MKEKAELLRSLQESNSNPLLDLVTPIHIDLCFVGTAKMNGPRVGAFHLLLLCSFKSTFSIQSRRVVFFFFDKHIL